MEKKIILILSVMIAGISYYSAHAAPKARPSGGKALPVEGLKKDYWSLGDPESEYSVVQKRTYVKKNRLEITPLVGSIASDPFVSDHIIGGSIGFYAREDLQFNILGWKDFTGDSQALTELKRSGTSTNSVIPNWYAGGGAEWSPIYGKLSLLGKHIIHYDLHLSANLGYRSTETGNYFTGMLGIGQIFFLSNHFGIRFDYRMSLYSERVIEKVGTEAPVGADRGTRINRGDIIALGVSFLI